MLTIFFTYLKTFLKSIQPIFSVAYSSILKAHLLSYLLFIVSILLVSCAGSKRFTSDEKNYEEKYKSEFNSVRVLLDEKPNTRNITVSNKVFLLNEENKIAEINKGNNIQFYANSHKLNAKVGRKNFSGKYFQLVPANGELIRLNGKTFRGILRIVAFGDFVDIINYINLEDYVKGVITKEMPLGNGDENYEALKAFAIVVRTYALNKMNEGKNLFDIFPDTRDQVYGGQSAEELISNKAVDETEGVIVIYDDKPAIIYYHSTCGGFTENVENVFSQPPVPYLISIKDGDGPYCKISPRAKWEEVYTEDQFIKQLFNAKLINDKNYNLEDINVNSRFNSGRVNELEILLNGQDGKKEIKIYGNEIRSIIRTPEKNLMLWSTMFNIKVNGNGNIIINGKGYGHGVGFCQWGAIGQSRQGRDYEIILKHYFPGTELGSINDPI
ncbi:MAG: SpoIID/LytB domain-containing protein [Ignavibacteria bacterium]|nr:MAG: SpoIID/LytB domain-containing protein [Ignavibacteria bacterium]